MIQLAMALLVGFLVGWLVFLRKEISFTANAAVILFALIETLSHGWLAWRKQRWEAEPKPLNTLLIWRFLIGCAFGILIIAFGEAIGEDLMVVALVPLATVFLLNLYKIVSE